jgi:hypothetical protein
MNFWQIEADLLVEVKPGRSPSIGCFWPTRAKTTERPIDVDCLIVQKRLGSVSDETRVKPKSLNNRAPSTLLHAAQARRRPLRFAYKASAFLRAACYLSCQRDLNSDRHRINLEVEAVAPNCMTWLGGTVDTPVGSTFNLKSLAHGLNAANLLRICGSHAHNGCCLFAQELV